MSFSNDLRHSVRTMLRAPGLASALVASVALGLGSNTVLVGFVRGFGANELPIPGIETLVSIFEVDESGRWGPVSYERYLALEARQDVFRGVGAARDSRVTFVVDGRTSIVSATAITDELADILGLPVRDGAVLSHRLWRDQLGGQPEVRGRPVRIDDRPGQVAGVARQGFEGLYNDSAVDVWMAQEDAWIRGAGRHVRTQWVIARLRSGVSRVDAQAALDATHGALGQVLVQPYTGLTPEATGGMLRLRRSMFLATALVFLVACCNVATFLLSRACEGAHEASIRLALGATRPVVVRRLVTDIAVIVAAGGVSAGLLAAWTGRMIPALLFDQDAERLSADYGTGGLIVAFLTSVVVMAVCALAPLLELGRGDPAHVLQREASGPSRVSRRLLAVLAVAQFACCYALLASSGLLQRGLNRALDTTVARHVGRRLVATLSVPPDLKEPERQLDYFGDAERAVRGVPGVLEAAWVSPPPGGRPAWRVFRAEPRHLPHKEALFEVEPFTPQSVESVVLPPTAGRLFGIRDTPVSCKVIVVDEAAATGPFQGDAVGRVVVDSSGERAEVIGVVATRAFKKGRRPPNPPTIFYYPQQLTASFTRPRPARFRVPETPELPEGVLDVQIVSGNYFKAMGLDVISGTPFDTASRTPGCRLGMVNQEGADLYFGGDAVGAALIDHAGRRTQIIGVVRSSRLRTTQRRVEPTIYYPMPQDVVPRMSLLLRSAAVTAATVGSVRRRLEGLPDGAPVHLEMKTLDEHLHATALSADRVAAALMRASGVIALVLSLLGLHRMAVEWVRRRRQEIAIRMAVGAPAWVVARQVLAASGGLAARGCLAGLAVSALLATWLKATPDGWSGFVLLWLWTPLVLMVTAIVGSLTAVWRALRIEPADLMRRR